MEVYYKYEMFFGSLYFFIFFGIGLPLIFNEEIDFRKAFFYSLSFSMYILFIHGVGKFFSSINNPKLLSLCADHCATHCDKADSKCLDTCNKQCKKDADFFS